MSFVAYHGSSKLFEHFIIDPALSVSRNLVEGYGIYLTRKRKLAEAIGEYTYEVLIEDHDFTDMSNRATVTEVIKNTLKNVHPRLNSYVNLHGLIDGVVEGEVSVVYLHEELCLQLDSNEKFYSDFKDHITYEEDCILNRIREAYLRNIGNVVEYYDKGYRHSNLICFRNPECLRIVRVKTETVKSGTIHHRGRHNSTAS